MNNIWLNKNFIWETIFLIKRSMCVSLLLFLFSRLLLFCVPVLCKSNTGLRCQGRLYFCQPDLVLNNSPRTQCHGVTWVNEIRTTMRENETLEIVFRLWRNTLFPISYVLQTIPYCFYIIFSFTFDTLNFSKFLIIYKFKPLKVNSIFFQLHNDWN